MQVMLTDFGLAKEIDESSRSNSMCGTTEYMAPEILLSKGHNKDADWWSIGILLYEMLKGQVNLLFPYQISWRWVSTLASFVFVQNCRFMGMFINKIQDCRTSVCLLKIWFAALLQPPFTHANRKKLQERIIKEKVKLPSYLTGEAHSLLKGVSTCFHMIFSPSHFHLVRWTTRYKGVFLLQFAVATKGSVTEVR